MIKIEYCPNEKKETRHEVKEFDTGKQKDISKFCLSCGLWRHMSSKSKKLIYKQYLELNPSKKYRGMDVDKGLNTNILDKMNSNKSIKIISVCTGHSRSVEPYAKVHTYPEVVFCSKIKLVVPKIKDTTMKTEKSMYGICYRLIGKKNISEWWKNIAEVVSKINSKEKLSNLNINTTSKFWNF